MARGGGSGAGTAVLRGPLRRAQASFALMWAGDDAFMVALAVVAFRDGGVAAVGAVTALRMAAAALLTPLLATTADRVRRERVLTAVGLVRAAALAGAAVGTATGGPVCGDVRLRGGRHGRARDVPPGALGPAAGARRAHRRT